MQERAIAVRMAAVERKLSGLQGACLGLEEDSSAVAARVDSLEVCVRASPPGWSRNSALTATCALHDRRGLRPAQPEPSLAWHL